MAGEGSPRRRVLVVVTSHDKLGNTGRATGSWLGEVTHAYEVFVKAGLAVHFASPKGGEPPIDPESTNAKDPANDAFLADARAMRRFRRSLATARVDATRFDAVYFAGGHGTAWDFPVDRAIASIAARVYEAGGVVGAVCHGPEALLGVRLSNGRPLVEGKVVTAFTNEEERLAGLDKVVPFLLEDRLVSLGPARFVAAPSWAPNVVVSERLVTGQNPASARGVADAMVGLLGKPRTGAGARSAGIAGALDEASPGDALARLDALVAAARAAPRTGELDVHAKVATARLSTVPEGQVLDLIGKPVDWKSGHTVVFLGKRKDRSPLGRSKFLERLARHVNLARERLVPRGLDGYVILASPDFELAVLHWKSAQALAATFPSSEDGKAVAADAEECLSPISFDTADRFPANARELLERALAAPLLPRR